MSEIKDTLKRKIILNSLFICGIVLLFIVSSLSPTAWPSTFFTLLLLVHWWIGTTYFFKIRPRPNFPKGISSLLYLAIAILLILTIIFIKYPILMFVFSGFSFIPVIPLYKSILKQETNDRNFVKIKYAFEYLGIISFTFNALIIFLNVLDPIFVTNVTIIVHALILISMLALNIYPNKYSIIKPGRIKSYLKTLNKGE